MARAACSSNQAPASPLLGAPIVIEYEAPSVANQNCLRETSRIIVAASHPIGDFHESVAPRAVRPHGMRHDPAETGQRSAGADGLPAGLPAVSDALLPGDLVPGPQGPHVQPG